MASVQSVGTTPSGGGGFHLQSLVPQSLGGMVETGTVLGQIGNAGYAAINGGKAALPDATTIFNDVKGFSFDGLWGAMKGLGTTMVKFGTNAGLIQGGLSLLVNGYRVFDHEISLGEAAGRVAGDTATGFVGGASAAAASGLAMAALPLLGISGGLLTLAGAVVGFGAYFLAEKMFKSSSLYQRIHDSVAGLMGDALQPLATRG